MKNSKLLLEHLRQSSSILDEKSSNSRVTQRDYDNGRHVKTKPNEKAYSHQTKLSHFTELINSLKS